VDVPAKASIERLCIAHWPEPGAALPVVAIADAFVVDTCQRRMLIVADGGCAGHLRDLAPPEIHTGALAYQFLLEVATGLRSAVQGETNVFGQFKRAWEAYQRTAAPHAVAALTPVITRAIRDTRTIRREHLQGIGGASYGALVRRLIRPGADDRILVIGAGHLARSLLAFLRPSEVGIWNRRRPGGSIPSAVVVFGPEEAALAARWADDVVFATPADDGNDRRWSARLATGAARRIVHLGRRRSQPFAWPAHAVTYDLDDIFELRRSQDNIRSLRVERARLACRERERSLVRPDGAPVSRLAAG